MTLLFPALLFVCGLAAGQETAAATKDDAQQPAPVPEAPKAAAAVEAQLAVTPPSWTDRRNVFFRKLVGPQAFIETVPGAIFDTARGFPGQWGRSGLGFAKRLGSQYGQFIVGEFIEAGVSVLHREDPRYFRMPGERFGKRLGHALSGTFVVRGAHGGRTLAVGRLANIYGSWAIATFWNPADQRNAVKIFGNGSLGIGIKAGSNVFREFWPDVKKRLKKQP